MWLDVAKEALVSPSNAGASGADVRVLAITEDAFPIFTLEPFLVIARTLKYVGAPADSPVLTTADVAVDLVFETTDFQVVLLLLASIL
jgi:hypothetical protein